MSWSGEPTDVEYPVDRTNLAELRAKAAGHGRAAGLSAARVTDLVVVVNELTGNVVRHGGGSGRLRLRADQDGVYCEVSDQGSGMSTPELAGRTRSGLDASTGRGLWMIRQLSDDVRIDSGPHGTAVRVTFSHS